MSHSIRDWEFDNDLNGGLGHFRLEFERPEIVDRKPTPGVTNISLSARAGRPTATFRLKVSRRTYPAPPSGIDSGHRDVQTLYQRYKGYREGKEPLPGFAYFCLSAIVWSVGPGKGLTEKAARQYDMDGALLRKISNLSSTKGGSQARKGTGVADALTQDEQQFLERATVRLIRRVAEYHGRNGNLPEVTIADIDQNA